MDVGVLHYVTVWDEEVPYVFVCRCLKRWITAKICEIKTLQRTTKDTRGGSWNEKKTKRPVAVNTSTQFSATLCASASVTTDLSAWDVVACVALLLCKRMWGQTSSSVPPLRPHPQTSWHIMPHDRERTWGWPYHATCPCDQLKKQQETAEGLSEKEQQHRSVSPQFRVLV